MPNSRYTITVENLTTENVTASPARARGTTFIQTVQADTRGVNRVTVTDTKGAAIKTYVSIGSAEIDCCIAKLVHDAINCTCKCNKCKEDLDRLKLSDYCSRQLATMHTLTPGENDKYYKAKELCTEVCACGC